MTEWWHRPALDQAHIRLPFGPANESVPRKLRPPPQPTNERLQQPLDQVPESAIGTDAAEENDFAAGSEHSGTLVKRRLRVWRGRNHVTRDHGVERSIGE